MAGEGPRPVERLLRPPSTLTPEPRKRLPLSKILLVLHVQRFHRVRALRSKRLLLLTGALCSKRLLLLTGALCSKRLLLLTGALGSKRLLLLTGALGSEGLLLPLLLSSVDPLLQLVMLTLLTYTLLFVTTCTLMCDGRPVRFQAVVNPMGLYLVAAAFEIWAAEVRDVGGVTATDLIAGVVICRSRVVGGCPLLATNTNRLTIVSARRSEPGIHFRFG